MQKLKTLSIKGADAAADIAVINEYSVKELTPDDVFCFSVVLCDNDVDRDNERFTDKTLDQLSRLFLGKTGIFDHSWSAKNQVARIYRTEVQERPEKNRLGEPLKQLVGSAYMLNNESTQPIIEAIEGGILKEVSVGCSIESQKCSLCGEPMAMNWNTWTFECKNGHQPGHEYDEGLCVCELDGAADAYEFSFVAVPAQRGAGVTKSVENLQDAFSLLMTADLSSCSDQLKSLLPRIQTALESAADREKRRAIIEENKKFLKG